MQHWAKKLGAIGAVSLFDYPYMKERRKRPDPLPKLIDAHRQALVQPNRRQDGRLLRGNHHHARTLKRTLRAVSGEWSRRPFNDSPLTTYDSTISLSHQGTSMWFQKPFKSLTATSSHCRPIRRRTPASRLCVEQLEDRTVPSNFTAGTVSELIDDINTAVDEAPTAKKPQVPAKTQAKGVAKS